jgi:hypothetical protein
VLWFNLKCNADRIGTVEIQRREKLDISDPVAIRDVVSTYTVTLDDRLIGVVAHRYGDGAYRLTALATELIFCETTSPRIEGHKTTALTYDEPTAWAVPAPPGPAVLSVRDNDGAEWTRTDESGDLWRAEGGFGYQKSWESLVYTHGPVTRG